jgi:hypothetical protein
LSVISTQVLRSFVDDLCHAARDITVLRDPVMQ